MANRPPRELSAVPALGDSASHPVLVLGEVRANIGLLEGDPEEVLGQISRVARTSRGDVVVLDARYNTLRFYDRYGRYLHSIGSPGHGPGEFVLPTAMFLKGDSLLYVADGRSNRITAFARSTDGWHFETSFGTAGVFPYDMCVLEDEIFVHGLGGGAQRGSQLVHVFSRSGELIRSFGQVYFSERALIHSSLSTGRIACVEPALIVLVPVGLPFVTGFKSSGEPLWSTMFQSFAPFRYVEFADRIENPIPDAGAQQTVGVVVTPGAHVLLQVGTFTTESFDAGIPFERLDSYVVHAETGVGWNLGSDLPLLGQIGAEDVVVVEELPHPRIELRSARISMPRPPSVGRQR